MDKLFGWSAIALGVLFSLIMVWYGVYDGELVLMSCALTGAGGAIVGLAS